MMRVVMNLGPSSRRIDAEAFLSLRRVRDHARDRL